MKQISNDDDERKNIFDTGMELINSAENTEVGKSLIATLISNEYTPQEKYELVKDHVRRYNEKSREKVINEVKNKVKNIIQNFPLNQSIVIKQNN